MAWTDAYNGHWVAADSKHVFELARCPAVSNDHDINGETHGYQGITIPKAQRATVVRGGILEMDEPEHSTYRGALNPYLSPAAIKRWQPFVDEIVRAALDEKIESGRIDFVDDLANIVPAVLHARDDGHRAEEVAGLQRARAPLGVHPGALARRRARRRDEPADGHRHDQHDDGDPGEPAARAWSTRCCNCASTASPLPIWRSWATSD